MNGKRTSMKATKAMKASEADPSMKAKKPKPTSIKTVKGMKGMKAKTAGNTYSRTITDCVEQLIFEVAESVSEGEMDGFLGTQLLSELIPLRRMTAARKWALPHDDFDDQLARETIRDLGGTN